VSDDVYRKLAKLLDTLPNGFPATDSGLEIQILEKIFTPEEAELFCDLRLSFETPIEIAQRTGRPLGQLDEMLARMWEKGQIEGAGLGPTRIFRMLPWVVGIWEMQVGRLDAELARLGDEYYEHFGPQLFGQEPRVMRTIPIEQDATPTQQALSFDRVSGIIEGLGAARAAHHDGYPHDREPRPVGQRVMTEVGEVALQPLVFQIGECADSEMDHRDPAHLVPFGMRKRNVENSLRDLKLVHARRRLPGEQFTRARTCWRREPMPR
jgi:hypothetical protein